jgi:O-antigen/teichoic acid export membrane protein
LAAVLGNALMAGERERITLRIVIVDLAASFVLGVLLIREYGVVGAAIASLLVRVIDVAQHYWPAARLLSGLSLTRLAWKSMLAGGAMAVVVWATQDLGWFAPLILGSVVYAAALAALMIYSYGGLNNLRESYFSGLTLRGHLNTAPGRGPMPSLASPSSSCNHNEREYEQVS